MLKYNTIKMNDSIYLNNDPRLQGYFKGIDKKIRIFFMILYLCGLIGIGLILLVIQLYLPLGVEFLIILLLVIFSKSYNHFIGSH